MLAVALLFYQRLLAQILVVDNAGGGPVACSRYGLCHCVLGLGPWARHCSILSSSAASFVPFSCQSRRPSRRARFWSWSLPSIHTSLGSQAGLNTPDIRYNLQVEQFQPDSRLSPPLAEQPSYSSRRSSSAASPQRSASAQARSIWRFDAALLRTGLAY